MRKIVYLLYLCRVFIHATSFENFFGISLFGLIVYRTSFKVFLGMSSFFALVDEIDLQSTVRCPVALPVFLVEREVFVVNGRISPGRSLVVMVDRILFFVDPVPFVLFCLNLFWCFLIIFCYPLVFFGLSLSFYLCLNHFFHANEETSLRASNDLDGSSSRSCFDVFLI